MKTGFNSECIAEYTEILERLYNQRLRLLASTDNESSFDDKHINEMQLYGCQYLIQIVYEQISKLTK